MKITLVSFLMIFCFNIYAADKLEQNTNSIRNASGEVILKDFRSWILKNAQNYKEDKFSVEVLSSTSTALKNINGTVIFTKYLINNAWYRVTGELISSTHNINSKVLFDSDFYMPECGSLYDIDLARASSFNLDNIQIIAIDEQLTSVVCDPAPMEKIKKTHFYAIRNNVEEILVLQTSHLKSDDNQTQIKDTIYYPNACSDNELDCKYLTVWSFSSLKPKLDVKNYSWNETQTRLKPGY